MPDSAQMRSWLAGMALLLCSVAWAADDGLVPLPSLSARATDLTGTLSADQKADVEAELAGIEGSTGAQVVLLLLPTTRPETIEQFGIRLAEAWKIGHKGADNGVIVIVAKNDRRVRIEVGYGLEGTLNDATCQRIISDYVAPRFKRGDYYGGIQAAVAGIRAVINTETPATADAATAPAPDRLDVVLDWLNNFGNNHDNLLLALLGTVLVGITALRYFLGNIAGSAIVGGVTGLAAYFLTLSFVSSLMAAGVGFLVALVGVDFIWGALLSGGSGGSSGSGSGGGFSGGGGGFGGGGSSGSW